MKKNIIITTAAIVFSSQIYADNKSCATVLCLGGNLLGGDGGSMCSSAVDDYFDIKKYRHGKFSGSRTSKARKEYLDKCKSEDNRINKERINAKWGMVEHNPL